MKMADPRVILLLVVSCVAFLQEAEGNESSAASEARNLQLETSGNGSIPRNESLRDQLVRESGGKVFTIANEEKVIIMQYVGWQHANNICTSIGMKLLSLQTREKWEAIHSYLQINGYRKKYFWTSGRKVNDVWTWTSANEDISQFNWREGQPDNTGDVCLYFFEDGLGWLDIVCDEDVNNVICE